MFCFIKYPYGNSERCLMRGESKKIRWDWCEMFFILFEIWREEKNCSRHHYFHTHTLARSYTNAHTPHAGLAPAIRVSVSVFTRLYQLFAGNLFFLQFYLDIYVLMYVCMNVHTYGCVYVCICTYVCMHACMHLCMYACIYACMHACMYVCMHACMYVCLGVCECVYAYKITVFLSSFPPPLSCLTSRFVRSPPPFPCQSLLPVSFAPILDLFCSCSKSRFLLH